MFANRLNECFLYVSLLDEFIEFTSKGYLEKKLYLRKNKTQIYSTPCSNLTQIIQFIDSTPTFGDDLSFGFNGLKEIGLINPTIVKTIFGKVQ